MSADDRDLSPAREPVVALRFTESKSQVPTAEPKGSAESETCQTADRIDRRKQDPPRGTTACVPARKPFPKLCYHKGTRRFFVDYQGSWRYWPTVTSKAIAQADYDAMRVAHEEGRPVQLPGAEQRSARTIDTLIQAYLAHGDVYYANSKPSVANIERALTPLHSRFGKRPMDTFGPRPLREVRKDLIQSGFSRKVINARVQTIVRMFKWAVAEELVPATIYEALRAVEGLRIGRTSAPEGPGRRPVPWEHVEPILPLSTFPN